jgi:hypothetical protein
MTCAGRARAEGSATDPSRHVEVVTAGRAEEAQPLESVLRELLARLDVNASFARASEIDARDRLGRRTEAAVAVAHVWIDLRRPDAVLLYIADRGLDRVLVRRVPTGKGIDEVAREELAYIVQATVDALLQGGQIGVAVERTGIGPAEPRREAPPAPPPLEGPPPATVDAPSNHVFAVGVGYEAQAWTSSQVPLHGPVVSLALALGVGEARPGVVLSGQWRFPVTIERDPIGLRLDEEAIRLAATLDIALGRHWAFRWLGGGGVDIVHVVPIAFAPKTATLDSPRISVSPVARAAAFLSFEFAAGKRATLGAASELDLVDTRYFIDRGSLSDTVLRPWRVRPAAVLEISADLGVAPPRGR